MSIAGTLRPSESRHPATGPNVPRRRVLDGALAAYEHQLLLYRRTWRGSIFGNFAQPALFLLAMGVGLGSYVDRANSSAMGGVSYLQFLAPALLASSVMQTSVFQSTFPVIGGFHWVRRYLAMYATPLTSDAIAFSQLAWTATRATMVGAIFALVAFLFGAAPLAGIMLAVPVGTLTGLAFAAPVAAFMATQRDTTAFSNLWRFGITPLFLFSGTFFPIEQLPEQIRWLAWFLPLWHGVVVCRALSLGTFMAELPMMLVHLAILVTVTVAGTIAMFVMFRRELEQ